MDRLGEHVRNELGRFGPVEGDLGAVIRAWPAAVGAENARQAWPARLSKDGTLHVNASNSVWAFQLGMLAPAILEKLRADLGEATPVVLKFAPGPVPDAEAGRADKPPEHRIAIAPEHRVEAAAIAAGIEDEELRELVARAAAASLAGAALDPPADRRF